MTSKKAARGSRGTARSKASAAIRSAVEPAVGAVRDIFAFLGLMSRTLASVPADVLSASIVINLLGLALPFSILQVYDRIVPNAATETLTLLAIGVVCAVVLETLLRTARSYVTAWIGMKAGWSTNVDAISRVALAPAALVDNQPAAQWIQRLNAVVVVSEFHVSPWPLVLLDLAFAGVFLAVLAASGGWLAAVPLTIFLFCSFVALRRSRELRRATAGRVRAEARMRDFLMEVMHGIVTIRALGAEQQILRRFERLSEQAAAHTRTVVRLADDAQSFSSSVSTLTQIGTATAGAVLAVRGEMSLGVVASSTMLASRVIQPLLRLVSAWNEIQAVMVAEEMMKPILALPARHHDRGEAGIRESGPLALTFDDVWFSYDESGPAVLEGATLDIRPARSSR
jgi:ATP-binding cassette subfamily C protein LapB